MDTRLNIFTQTEQVEFIPVSLCHGQLIEYHHYCLSLARPNDMKKIRMQECHGLSWNLQDILFNRRRQGKMCSYQFNNYSYESHSTFSSWSSPWYNSNKRKRNSEKHTEIFLEFLIIINKQIKSNNEKNYLHGKAPKKQKKNKEIFLGFLFSATTKHAYISKLLQLIFCYFSKVVQVHKNKSRK